MVQNLENEIWKTIDMYDNTYQVSNYGRFKRIEHTFVDSKNRKYTKEEKLLSEIKHKSGYLYVKIGIQNLKAHRLVALAFVQVPEHLKEKPIEELEIDHIDMDKTNNKVENLRWCTHNENMNFKDQDLHSILSEHTAQIKNDPIRSKKMYQYNLDGTFVKEWESGAECTRNGFKHSNDCAVGKCKTAYGFIWSHIPPSN